MRATLDDGRQLAGQMLAYDKVRTRTRASVPLHPPQWLTRPPST